MKYLVAWLALLSAGCVTHAVPVAAPQAPIFTFGVVACGVPVALDAHCPSPIVDATIRVNSADGYVAQPANQDGYALFTSTIAFSDIWISAPNFADARANIQPPAINLKNLSLPLTPLLPMPPTRDEILNVQLTFQGLTVPTAQFGTLPWFEAALPWLTPSDRANAYAAKHASTAWGAGDTHALIFLPSGPALYDESNQPYSADRFGPLDWTAGNTKVDGRLADLVAEVARAGFNRQLLFLGGDDGEAGFPIAMTQLDLVHDALASSAYGDLRPYVIVYPGFDGVFYGYTPEHIFEWGEKCRGLFLYCGIEHSTGHIPTGEGDADWVGSGRMRAFDSLLSEFNDNQFDDTVWQIMARLIGPHYVRPPNQPATDDPTPPFYLRQPTDRGPIVNCQFEFKEYTFVRDGNIAAVNSARDYFKHAGATCGG